MTTTPYGKKSQKDVDILWRLTFVRHLQIRRKKTWVYSETVTEK